MRRIEPIDVADIIGLAVDPGAAPEMRWVDPLTLLVEEEYQRDLSKASEKLIRRMVRAWDWSRFKAPNVVELETGLAVVDGQHTAIGAATNPYIELIPVLVGNGLEVADRAASFVGINSDRIQLTSMQVYYAKLVAGDEDAMTIDQVVKKAGVTILKVSPTGVAGRGAVIASGPRYPVRSTMALGAIQAAIRNHHAMGARRVLTILADADLAPITAPQIKAVSALLFHDEFKGAIHEDRLSGILKGNVDRLQREVDAFVATHQIAAWKGWAAILYQKSRKRRA